MRALVGARDLDAIVVGLAERGLCSLTIIDEALQTVTDRRAASVSS